MKKYMLLAFGTILTGIIAGANDRNSSYTSPAKNSEEALEISTGRFSTGIYGSFPDESYSLRTPGGEFATMTIRHSLPVKSKMKSYRRGMGDDGIAYTDITLTDGLRDQDIFASRGDSVIVIEYGDELQLNATISLSSKLPYGVKSFDDWIVLVVDDAVHNNRLTTMLKVLPGPGNITTNPDGSLTLNYMRGASLLLTNLSSPMDAETPQDADSDSDKARMRLFLAGFKGVDKLRKERDKEMPAGGDDTLRDLYKQAAGLTAEGDTPGVQEDRLIHSRIGSAPDNVVTISLLPVVPADLEEEGEVEGLHALGGFEVGFGWDKGKVTGGYIQYTPREWQVPDDEVDVNVIINGEINALTMRPGEKVRLESFMNLVRPYIE